MPVPAMKCRCHQRLNIVHTVGNSQPIRSEQIGHDWCCTCWTVNLTMSDTLQSSVSTSSVQCDVYGMVQCARTVAQRPKVVSTTQYSDDIMPVLGSYKNFAIHERSMFK